jgi:hypothetical protein
MYVSIEHKGRVREILSGWHLSSEARIAVVTDGKPNEIFTSLPLFHIVTI